MKSWVDLYGEHQWLRGMHDREVANELRAVLRRLSEKPYAALRRDAQSRLVEARAPRSTTVQHTLGRERSGEALLLSELPEPVRDRVALREALLSVLLRFDRSVQRLQELNIMLSGLRLDGTPWALAVHLPHEDRTLGRPQGDREGLGACGHAALHCHVGPTLDVKPKIRVPLPPLRPAQIVEWMISQAIPTPEFEPAPWPGVEAMLHPS